MSTSVAARTIPFFNYKGAFTSREDEYLDFIRGIIRRGAFIQQQDLVDFESHLRQYLGVKHAFGVGNATDGLIMAWRAAGLMPGDEVILPSHTMVATAAAVHFAGGVPVLADCGRDHLIDPDSVEGLITPRTRAICPVQLNGRTADMDRLQTIADRHGLFILEDAAQALGSKFQGRFAGTFGVAAAFSFYPAKILGCFGDGGAVVTNDDAVAERIALLRDHGRNDQGDVVMWGLNSRLDNMQAGILDIQLRDYHEIIDHRRTIAARYQATLGDLRELTLPPAPGVDQRHFDVYQNYEIEADRRDQLREHLRLRGVGTIIQWGGKAVHQNVGLGFQISLPATERLFGRCLMLPMNMMVGVDDVEYIAGVIREFYRST